MQELDFRGQLPPFCPFCGQALEVTGETSSEWRLGVKQAESYGLDGPGETLIWWDTWVCLPADPSLSHSGPVTVGSGSLLSPYQAVGLADLDG